MINERAKLHPDVLIPGNLQQTPSRDGFGRGLVEAGERDERVVALCADLAESTRMHWFAEKFPDRYIELGVAEQNLATVGSGMANYGKVPFIASYATFSPGRNWEQIRTTIALNNVPVKVVGSHAGVSVAQDGATHQALEDIALMRTLPNMTIVVPCDAEEARKATLALAQTKSPAYIRLARAASPSFTTRETPFQVGKAQILWESSLKHTKKHIGIVACGSLVYEALQAAVELEEEKIKVTLVNLATIKPLDEKALLTLAKDVDAIVTVEEHQIAGGMGSAVAEFLVQKNPVPMAFVGVQDKFGQSGTPDELIKYYGMDKESIKKTVKNLVKSFN